MKGEKKLTAVQSMYKELATIKDELKLQNKRLSLLSLHTANDFRTLQDRSILTWEMMHALMSFLEDKCGLTDAEFDTQYEKVRAKFKEERLNDKKSQVQLGQNLCLTCLNVVGSPQPLTDTECPRCKKATWWAPAPPPMPVESPVQESTQGDTDAVPSGTIQENA